MKLALASLALALSATALSAHADCFRTGQIRNHTVVDKSTALINVDDRSVYRIVTSGDCFAGATTSDPLVMRSPPGSTMVCKPIDMDLGVKVGGGPTRRCIVGAITRLSPDEVAALPKKLKP
ncbi:MAG TPA: hypothetical protein VHV27_06705 [Phenylobacterium sp.]|jgi:hypothetical protein|nr:hypothetical protein [Phenylobacterium sp.]